MGSAYETQVPEWFARLKELYRDIDAEIARLGANCKACGKCCLFGPGAPRLYASWPERAFLLHSKPVQGVKKPGCPYLDRSTMLCTAREHRTLGCRTYFCERALPETSSREAARALYERALARLREIVRAFDLEWDYADTIERLGLPPSLQDSEAQA